MRIANLFYSKDRKYNGKDDESYDEFIDQYLAAFRDLCLSPSDRQQYLHNLFYSAALRFYNANIVGRARQFFEGLQMMKEQCNSASKQQQVKAELSKISYDNFLGKNGWWQIESIQRSQEPHSLYPGMWKNEIHKIGFLRDALVTEDWAENTLSRFSAPTSWRGLRTEIGNGLHIRIEREIGSRETEVKTTDLASKPSIFFTAPRYAKKISKAMFSGSEFDDSC